MTRCGVLILLVLLGSTSARAEDWPFTASKGTLLAAHGGDLASTIDCLARKTCQETNPWLGRFTTNKAGFGAIKMTGAGIGLWAVDKLHEHHPTLATWVNVGLTGFFAAITISNVQKGKPKP